MDAGNLISGSSAFCKTSLNIWKFMVHVLLKPGLENFEYYFTSMWDECSCVAVWALFGIIFLRLSGVKEQYVVQYIFLLVFTWVPSLDLISATIGKTFCHYHISPSDGWSLYPTELNPIGEPIMKYVSYHVGSVQFSHSVMSNSLQPLEPQHARPHCPSVTPGIYPNSCPLNR